MSEEKMAAKQFREALHAGSDIDAYDVASMDEASKEMHRNYMKAAHHKFMAKHHKRKMYKKC